MLITTTRNCFLLILLLAGPPSVLAQHATAFDVIDGKQAFQKVCANCHGPDGNLVANVDLGHGTFRKPYTDTELANLIMTGIPNTPMPANPGMSEAQALKLVAYLRSLAIAPTAALAGDAANGQALFESREGDCLSCHSLNGRGSALGPELGTIGLQRTAAELETSLRYPEQQVQASDRFYTVVTLDNKTVTGRLLNHDAFSVQLLDTDEKLRSFMKTDLREYGFTTPPMPALQESWSNQDIADLVEYLVTLRGTAQ